MGISIGCVSPNVWHPQGIDTANQPKHYNESLVGVALATAFGSGLLRRDQLFLQTKYTPVSGQLDDEHMPYPRDAPIAEQVAASLQGNSRSLLPHHTHERVVKGDWGWIGVPAKRRRSHMILRYESRREYLYPAGLIFIPERANRMPFLQLVCNSMAYFLSSGSLEHLGTTYIDSFVLHEQMAKSGEMLQVWRAMEAAYDAGTVRALTVCAHALVGLRAAPLTQTPKNKKTKKKHTTRFVLRAGSKVPTLEGALVSPP